MDVVMTRLCPDDLSVLVPHQVEGIEVDRCPECGGLYFDDGELAAFQDKGYDAMQTLEAEGTASGLVLIGVNQVRTCPGCSKPMMQYRFQYASAICLDGCNHCGGIWVQDGELGEIATYVRRQSRGRAELPGNISLLADREASAHGETHRANWSARLLGIFFDRGG